MLEHMQMHPASSSGGKRFHFKLPKLKRNQRRRNQGCEAVDSKLIPGSPEGDDTSCSPKPEEPSFQQNLERCRLAEAARQLIEREERLFGEIRELQQGEDEGEQSLLAGDRAALMALVERALKDSLNPDPDHLEVLRSAVGAMVLEEKQDRRWRDGRTHTLPAWRPGRLRTRHDALLRQLVEERMEDCAEGAPGPAGGAGLSSIQKELCGYGRQLRQDLRRVVQVVRICYPPQVDVCNLYARLYHHAFRSRIISIAEFSLDAKDCFCLLRWVHDFYPNILKAEELSEHVDYDTLGKLLPQGLHASLEEQYLERTQSEVQTFITRTLEEVKKEWMNGILPESRDGCFSSPMAIDVIQRINGAVLSLEVDLGMQSKAESVVRPLGDFLQSLSSFHGNVMKSSRPNSRAVVMATLPCAEQFRDYVVRKEDLFPVEVKKTCLSALSSIKQRAHSFLLRGMHSALKPHYQALGRADWLKLPAFQGLMSALAEQIQDLQRLEESCRQELVGQLHVDVTVEVVSRILRGNIKVKNQQQELAAATLQDNAASLRELFTQAGSSQHWVGHALLHLAEVLKLQDLPSVQIEVVSMATAFPDLSMTHLSAMLKMKSSLSREHRRKVKDVFSDCQDQGHAPGREFFSRINLK